MSTQKRQLFQQIYDQHRSKVMKLCMSYVNDYDVAADMMQETFIKVWDNMDKFRNEASYGTWIYRIAVNTCLSHIRSEKNKVKDELSDYIIETQRAEESETEANVAVLYKCIADLEQNERMIITLVLDDVPYPEIAEVFGISEGNLRVKIHRIKSKLTQLYNRHERV